jgi:hypothetical protein
MVDVTQGGGKIVVNRFPARNTSRAAKILACGLSNLSAILKGAMIRATRPQNL